MRPARVHLLEQCLRSAGLLLCVMTLHTPMLCAEEAPVPSSTPGTTAASSKPPAETWNAARLQQGVKALASPVFVTREKASRALHEAPPSQLEPILKARLQSTDPEVRKRLHDVAHHLFDTHVLKHLAEWRVGRGFLGIQWSISDQPPGFQVGRVIENTAAARDGLQDSDLIIQADDWIPDENVTHDSAMNFWRSMAPGDSMKLRVLRGQPVKEIELTVTIGEVPASVRSPEADRPKAARIWKAYLDGLVTIPPELLGDQPFKGLLKLPSRKAREQARNAAKTENGDEAQAADADPKPLQTWPPEMEAPDAP